MKNSKKLSDAIGQVDEKYINEYINGQTARRPMIWRTVIAATLAVALLAGTVLALPYMRGNAIEQSEELPNHPGPAPGYIDLTDSAANVEYITDDAGNRVLHVKDTLEIPDNIALSLGLYPIVESMEQVLYNWSNIIDNAKRSTSPEHLIFIGTPVSKDVYVWDEEVTINGEGWVVEYDVASGTTAIKEIYEYEPYQAIRRTTVQLSGIRIDEILKENNTTGCEVGDVIYFYSEIARNVEQIGPNIPTKDTSIYWGDIDIDVNLGIPETAVPRPAPDTAIESGAYIPATPTAEPSFIPTTTPAPMTEIAPETVPEIDYNGDGKVDEQDKTEEATTLPSSGQRLYVAQVNTHQASEIVKNSGIVPEQLWDFTHSCTAEEYRSGKFPNDISNMP